MAIETKVVKIGATQKTTGTYKGGLRRGFMSDNVWYNIVGADEATINAQFNPELIDRNNTVEVSYDPSTRNVESVKLVEKGQPRQFGGGGRSYKDDTVYMTHDQLDEAMVNSIAVVFEEMGIETEPKTDAERLKVAEALTNTGMAAAINSLFIAKTRSSFNKV